MLEAGPILAARGQRKAEVEGQAEGVPMSQDPKGAVQPEGLEEMQLVRYRQR